MDAFTLAAKLTLDSGTFYSSLGSVERTLNNSQTLGKFTAWGTAIGNLAAKAFSTAMSGALRFAESVVTTGMDFDAMISGVASIKEFTEEELTAVREKALALGASTKFTAAEVGQAFFYMAQAGWGTNEMLNGIDGVLQLAAASGEDLGRSSSIVTAALTAMGYKASDASHFVDVLAATAANSDTTIGMMGEAMKYLGTTGGVLYYSMEDLSIAMGLLANNGIKSTQAGTSLRQILNTLISPTTDAAEAMLQLGISLFEPKTGARKPLLQVMTELRQVYKDYGVNTTATLDQITEKENELAAAVEAGTMTQQEAEREMSAFTGVNQQFLAQMAEIGGLRGISSLLAIMQSSDEKFEQLKNSVYGSEGEGARMASEQLNNLKGDITLFNSAVDGLKILISDEYKTGLRSFVQTFTTEIGNLATAFEQGGVGEMFVNLSNWIIDGITGALSNPEITQEGAEDFGQALGNFVGNLVSKLVTSAPTVISGLFTAGMSLAQGLVEGLFAGLFGVGDGTVWGAMQQAGEERDQLISDANQTAAQANGVVNYMESLVTKYGEAAKESGEWAKALAELEQLIPGVTSVIQKEGDALSTTTGNLRDYIEQSRLKAIEDAKQAYVGDLRNKLYSTLSAQGEAEINADLAQAGMQESVRWLANYIASADTTGNTSAEGLVSQVEAGTMSFNQLAFAAQSVSNELNDTTGQVDAVIESYNTNKTAYDTNSSKVDSLSQEVAGLQTQLQIAEAAVARMAEQAGSFTVPTFSTYGEWANYHYGKHAKGAWDIPYDNYMASLHRGEMVLTATQARQYREVSNGMNGTMLAEALRGAVLDLAMELDGETVGRVIGERATPTVGDNLGRMSRQRRYGRGG